MKAYIDASKSEVAPSPEWEKRVISFNEIVGVKDSKEILALFREWLLGGENSQWKYMRDNITNDLILWRR